MSAIKAAASAVGNAARWVPETLGKALKWAWDSEKLAKEGDKLIEGGQAVFRRGKIATATADDLAQGAKTARGYTKTRRTAVVIGGAVVGYKGVKRAAAQTETGAEAFTWLEHQPAEIKARAEANLAAAEEKYKVKQPGVMDQLKKTANESGIDFGVGSVIGALVLGAIGLLGGTMATVLVPVLAIVGLLGGQSIMDAITKKGANDNQLPGTQPQTSTAAPPASQDPEIVAPRTPADPRKQPQHQQNTGQQSDGAQR